MLTHVGESGASTDTPVPPVNPLTSTFVLAGPNEDLRGWPCGGGCWAGVLVRWGLDNAWWDGLSWRGGHFVGWQKVLVRGIFRGDEDVRYAPDGVLAVAEMRLSWCLGGLAPVSVVCGETRLSWGFSEVDVRGGSGGGVGRCCVCRAWWCPLPSIR